MNGSSALTSHVSNLKYFYFLKKKINLFYFKKVTADSVHVAEEHFHPSNEVITKFKRDFPVRINEPSCGASHVDANRRSSIQTWSFGSESANWAEFPWAVKVYYANELICSGSLISKSVVLTAGHCFQNGARSHNKIHIGVINDRSNEFYDFFFLTRKLFKLYNFQT